MKSFIAVSAVAALIAPAFAAESADVLGLPKCVKPCLDFSVVATSCERDDLSCLCADANFEYALNKCMFSQCQPHEYQSSFNYLKVVCPEGMNSLSMSDEPDLKKVLVARQASSSSSSASRSASSSSSGSPTSSAAPSVSSSAAQHNVASNPFSTAITAGVVSFVAIAGHALISAL